MENNSRPTQPHQKDDVCIHKTEAPGPIGPLLQWDHSGMRVSQIQAFANIPSRCKANVLIIVPVYSDNGLVFQSVQPFR